MDNWLPAHRKADGVKGALRDGLSHAGRHSVSVRAGRSVHDLRRLPLLGAGPDLAEPHVLDDRHDRSRRPARRPDDREQGIPRRIPLDHLCRAAGKGRRELEGLSAAGQLRLQHAGEFQDVPASADRIRRSTQARHGARAGRAVRIRRDATTNCRPSRGSSRPARNPSIPTTCPPPARRLSPARSTRSRPTRKSGRRPRSFSTTTKTTASSTTSRRRCRRRARRSEFVDGLPIGGGFRVPCIIVSPWTAGGWVCSQPFDHTSVLQFLEKFTGVREPNITDWRRKTFGDLTAAFRFNAERADPPRLPQTAAALERAKYEAAQISTSRAPGLEAIHAEAGKRPTTARVPEA